MPPAASVRVIGSGRQVECSEPEIAAPVLRGATLGAVHSWTPDSGILFPGWPIGVLLGAVARVAHCLVARGCYSRCVRTGRRPGFRWMRAAVCALAGVDGRPLGAPLEAVSGCVPPRSREAFRSGAGNLGRLCAEEVVLLGAAAALTGVVLDAAAQGRWRRRWPRRSPGRDAAGSGIPSMRLVAVRVMPGSLRLCGPRFLLGACGPLRSARCRVTEGPAARCESTRSRSMRARMCARRLTRPSSMTMRSASARAFGFLPWSFPRLARAAALPTFRPRCSGHPSQPAAPAAVTRRRAVAPGRCVGQPDVSGGRPGRLVCRRDTPRPGRRCPGPQARFGRASPGLARHERGPTDGAPGTGRVLRGLLATACETPTRRVSKCWTGQISPVRDNRRPRPQSRSGRDSSPSHATAWATPSGPEGRLCWSRPIGWEQATRLRRRSARRRRHTRRRRAARCGRRRSGALSRPAGGLRRD